MKVFSTKSNLLLLYLKQRYQKLIHLADPQEAFNHAPNWAPGKGLTAKVMLYKGDIGKEFQAPTWDGELYILGDSKIGQKLDLDLYSLIPELITYKRLFTPTCWHFLEKRYRASPLICEWEVSVLLDWLSKGEGKPPIVIGQAKEVLQIEPPSELIMNQYKRVWGTQEGAKFLYKLSDNELWLLIHKCLEFHFQGRPALRLELQHTRNRCEQGSPVREEAIMLNSLINKYTSSKT
jgi:hypothetical protein